MDAIEQGTNNIEISDILNLKPLNNVTGSNHNTSTGNQTNNHGSNSTRTSMSLNRSNGEGGGEGYLFIRNYDNKVEQIKDKQELMYPDVLLGNINKYPLFYSYFTSHTNGTTFRKEIQDFSTISNDELLETTYKRTISNSDLANLHRTFDKEFEDIPKLTNRFNKWKDNIEKTLKAVLKDLDNTEKQLKEQWDYHRKEAKIKFDADQSDTKNKSNHVFAPKKPLLNYLNAAKGFINDILSSISSLANAYPKLVGRGTNHIFGLMMEYYDKFYF